jgi:hypothetical protein
MRFFFYIFPFKNYITYKKEWYFFFDMSMQEYEDLTCDLRFIRRDSQSIELLLKDKRSGMLLRT